MLVLVPLAGFPIHLNHIPAFFKASHVLLVYLLSLFTFLASYYLEVARMTQKVFTNKTPIITEISLIIVNSSILHPVFPVLASEPQ